MQCEGYGVEGHPPDESLRWDETPLVAVRPTSLQINVFITKILVICKITTLIRPQPLILEVGVSNGGNCSIWHNCTLTKTEYSGVKGHFKSKGGFYASETLHNST